MSNQAENQEHSGYHINAKKTMIYTGVCSLLMHITIGGLWTFF